VKPYYEHAGITIYHGNCLEVLPEIGPVDAVVTDPPYGLEFMGKGWDRGVPGVEFWERVAGAMKPGAHLLAFGGTRTFHRLTCAIEDAGLEIRDCIMWLYGSGFPKSLDVGKAIDKAAGAEREVMGRRVYADGHVQNSSPDALEPPIGTFKRTQDRRDITAPATDAAKQWDGWGTALKPAWEPIILARKPLEGTVAENVLKHGVGGLNIDRCRIEFNGPDDERESKQKNRHADFDSGPRDNKVFGADDRPRANDGNYDAPGRWPANVIHDGSEEVMESFPDTSTHATGSAGVTKATKSNVYGSYAGGKVNIYGNDKGSAARFFYCAKANRQDRHRDNDHPTVKPLALMRYLCRLIAPPGGVVLDPFMGSGPTLRAARDLGCKAIGIEIEEHYCEIAAKRLDQGVFAFGGAGK
jgi:site-specific DNA-methyltransferase (adenine-specific)